MKSYQRQHPRAGELAQQESMIRKLRAHLPAYKHRTHQQHEWAKTAASMIRAELRQLEAETARHDGEPEPPKHYDWQAFDRRAMEICQQC